MLDNSRVIQTSLQKTKNNRNCGICSSAVLPPSAIASVDLLWMQEEIRQQIYIYIQAEEGCASSPAGPEATRVSSGYSDNLSSADGDEKPPSPQWDSAIVFLPSNPSPSPFTAVMGGCSLSSASEISGRPIFLCRFATVLEAEEGPIKVTFSLPQRADSLFEERKLITLLKGWRMIQGDILIVSIPWCMQGLNQATRKIKRC